MCPGLSRYRGTDRKRGTRGISTALFRPVSVVWWNEAPPEREARDTTAGGPPFPRSSFSMIKPELWVPHPFLFLERVGIRMPAAELSKYYCKLYITQAVDLY